MKVLIVDDSLVVRERLENVLSEVPDVEAISKAKNKSEAISLLHKLNPEVMIIDIQMPGGSGIDLLKKTKKERNPPLVVVLTNLSDSQYRKKCIAAGADFFFDKSTEFEKVTGVLKNLS